jgi:formiminotetrahydrofolate cyclodeaminase
MHSTQEMAQRPGAQSEDIYERPRKSRTVADVYVDDPESSQPYLVLTSHPGDQVGGVPIKLDQKGISHISFGVENLNAFAQELVAKGEKVIAALEALVDKDAEVFEPLSKAYGMPKETEEEKKLKAETMEACGKTACSVPLDIMRQAYEGIKIHQRMGEIGTMIAISDVACGVAFLKAALIAGSLNVIININGIKDEEFNKAAKAEMDQLLADGSKIADETLALVLGKLQK